MSSIVTNEFRVQNAQNFISDVKLNNYYIAIGKIDDWQTSSRTPLNTREIQIYNWNSMIGGKKILDNRISLVIPRIDWTMGTIYSMYDDTNDELDTSSFYVLTDESNVYKCLDNNNGAASTVKPTGTNISNIILSDGYIWKFMYKISIEESNNFVTNNFIPVKTLLEGDDSYQWAVQSNAIDGNIEVIKVTNGGVGYQNAPEIVITGNGVGATAVATIEDGIVTKIQVTDAGSGYTYAKVEIIGDCTQQATAHAIMSPNGGHGSDPANELFGRHVMLGATLNGSEDEQIPVTNDFRIITIVRDPTFTGDPEYTEDFNIPTVFNQLTRVTLATGYTGELNLDDIVTGLSSGATGKIANFDTTNNIISLCNVIGEFTPNESIETSSGGVTVIGDITPPDFIANTGSIIYCDYRNPISRATDQEENIRVTLEF